MSGIVTPSLALTTAGSGSGILIAICTLFILLIYKEILLTNRREWAMSLNKALTIVVVPLLLLFAMTAGLQIVKLLR